MLINLPSILSSIGSFDRNTYYKEFIYICSDDRRGQLSFVRARVDDIVIANTFLKSPEGNISDIFETSSIKIDDIIHTATSIAVTTYVRRQRNNPKDESLLRPFFSCAHINDQLVVGSTFGFMRKYGFRTYQNTNT